VSIRVNSRPTGFSDYGDCGDPSPCSFVSFVVKGFGFS
jgi:hypothetical protein